MAETARQTATRALLRFEREEGYSNIVWESVLRDSSLSLIDRQFASRLYYGVIERRLTLDALLCACSSVPRKRVHPAVWMILRVGAYQLVYMERVPPSAAVNEAVKLTRSMKQERASGYVNGVLRGVQRQKEAFFAALSDDEIRYSCPRELLELWKENYGEQCCAQLAQSLNTVADTCVRINTLHISTADFCAALDEASLSYTVEPFAPDAVRLAPHVRLESAGLREGEHYYFQDAASQIAVRALELTPGMRVADVCAAPGGKSFTAAQYLQNDGALFSYDIYPAKCEVVKGRAAQLGIICQTVGVHDATAPYDAALKASFDRVICDAPCSGLGVIRRKPEIRYKSLSQAAELPALQYAILCRSAELVKVGGVLQYSTCTLRSAENEDIARRFLAEHPTFCARVLPLDDCFAAAEQQASHELTLFPFVHGTDGFYIASFTRTV